MYYSSLCQYKYNRCPTSTALMRELTLLRLCGGSLYIKFALILLVRWSRAKTTRICGHKKRQQLNSRLSFPKLASPRGRQWNLGRLLQHLQRSKRWRFQAWRLLLKWLRWPKFITFDSLTTNIFYTLVVGNVKPAFKPVNLYPTSCRLSLPRFTEEVGDASSPRKTKTLALFTSPSRNRCCPQGSAE